MRRRSHNFVNCGIISSHRTQKSDRAIEHYTTLIYWNPQNCLRQCSVRSRQGIRLKWVLERFMRLAQSNYKFGR